MRASRPSYATLYKSLMRDPRFVRVGPGEFMIKEMVNGKRTTKEEFSTGSISSDGSARGQELLEEKCGGAEHDDGSKGQRDVDFLYSTGEIITMTAAQMNTQEAAIRRWAKKVKAIPTVVRMEIDFNRGMWYVTILDERWSMQRGIFHPNLEDALKHTYEDLTS